MGDVRPFTARRRGRLNRDTRAIFNERSLPDIMNDETLLPEQRLAARVALREVDRQVLISKQQEFAVFFSPRHAQLMRHLRLESRHPMIAAELFSVCVTHMDWTTCEVMRSREQLAKELGVKPNLISRLMGELVKCGAISRKFEDEDGNRTKTVRYFVSAWIAYRGEMSSALEVAQAKAGPLKLVGGTDLPTERRSRAASVSPVVL